MSDVTVDFVAKLPGSEGWKLVLVESEWDRALDVHLKNLQERLYDCIDAVIDGQFAKTYPESVGKKLEIHIDCYNLEKDSIREFFATFSQNVFSMGEYKNVNVGSKFVEDIYFTLSFHYIN